jgi:hypothetical protein
MNYEKEIEKLLTPLPHKLQVRFALDCALDVKHLMGPEAIQALDVVGKWLKGEATQAEVADAAARANYAARAASHADYAANAAYAVYNAAYHAAQSASYAANAAAYASYAANALAAAENRDKKIKEYYENLRSMILNMSELERLIYGLTE